MADWVPMDAAPAAEAAVSVKLPMFWPADLKILLFYKWKHNIPLWNRISEDLL